MRGEERRRLRGVAVGATAAVLLALGIGLAPHDGASAAYLPGDVIPGTGRGLDSLREPLASEQFYFVMTDRFANGDPSNDRGGLEGDRTVTGFDPTDKGFYHGGDLRGVIDQLDYIQGLGTTAIWLTPSFVNKPVQGPPGDESAAYHGYWITDFTQIDPHLGTNEEMKELIDAAHARGMKVFFDIITNHTADVIDYAEGEYDYRPLSEPPYTPVFRTPEDEQVKVPAWLNDPARYHNRGNTTFEGESSLYGDFFGLDDLATEQQEVVDGMIEIYQTWLDFGIDGFRIDTVKHVNLEFWQQFSRGIAEHAKKIGKDDFFMFGEVWDPNPPELARFTTEGRLPAVLDFAFQADASAWVRMGPSNKLAATLSNGDDLYTTPHSNAYLLPTFLGNHDMGRIAMQLKGLTRSEEAWLQRVQLGHTLMLLVRGQPVVYYGDEQGFIGSGGDKDARQDLFATQTEQYASEPVLAGAPGSMDRYDTDHPIYRHIADLARLRADHPALAGGIFQLRSASDGPGGLAFSRIDRERHVEYVVALNNTSDPVEIPVPTSSPATEFTAIWGGTGTVRADDRGVLTVTAPPLGGVVFQAAQPVPAEAAAPQVTFTDVAQRSEELSDRRWTQVDVAGPAPVQVTFERRTGDGDWQLLGVDDNEPYRIWDEPASEQAQYRAIVTDLTGRSTTVESGWVAPTAPADPGTAAVTAPGDYQDEIGCPTDWAPECEVSLLNDDDGDGVFTWTTEGIPAGQWEFKIALDRSWDENYGAGGARDGANIPLEVPSDGTPVTISYDSRTHAVMAEVG